MEDVDTAPLFTRDVWPAPTVNGRAPLFPAHATASRTTWPVVVLTSTVIGPVLLPDALAAVPSGVV
jgi:hypothetical protein